jgi:hypothetical protein
MCAHTVSKCNFELKTYCALLKHYEFCARALRAKAPVAVPEQHKCVTHDCTYTGADRVQSVTWLQLQV